MQADYYLGRHHLTRSEGHSFDLRAPGAALGRTAGSIRPGSASRWRLFRRDAPGGALLGLSLRQLHYELRLM